MCLNSQRSLLRSHSPPIKSKVSSSNLPTSHKISIRTYRHISYNNSAFISLFYVEHIHP